MSLAKNLVGTLLLLCASCTTQLLVAQTKNDCYYTKSGEYILIGNSKIEITIDSTSGVVVGMLNKATNSQFLKNGKADVFQLNYSNYENHGAISKDVWSAGFGSNIYGSKQKLSNTGFQQSAGGAKFSASYESMTLGRRNIPVSVTYTIELRSGDEETKWYINIENKDVGTIREVHFPVFAGLQPMNELIMPNHGGQRLSNPTTKLSDEHPVVYLEYPARASMQWFSYYSKQSALYMASYDSTLSYTRMYFGRHLQDSNNTAMWFVKYPFVISGGSWQSPALGVGIDSGDWHSGADRYRRWIESWVQKPKPPKHIVEMTGGGTGLWIKDRDTKTVSTYDDILESTKRLKEGPVKKGVMLVGWFFNGHDTYFPEYNAIPELGGDSALIKAVNKVHQNGHLVNAYMNGRLCNNETETYKKFGKKWAALGMSPGLGVGSINFYELHEGWNKAWDHTKKSEGWFSVMCPSAKGWQDHIVGQVLHGVRDYGFDGIFLDQPGSYYAELCYNGNHGHSSPATAWGGGYLEIFRRIYADARKIKPEFAIWSEGMNDAYSQYLDYHTDKNPVWVPMRAHPEVETFVEMWRYTMPWCVTQNGRDKYSLPASKHKVYGDYYRFLLGIRGISQSFDTSWRGSAADSLQRIAVTNKVETLWRKGRDYFFYGTFKDDVVITTNDSDVIAKAYTAAGGVAIPVWNTSDQSKSFELKVDLTKLLDKPAMIKNVSSLETGKRANFKSRAATATVILNLPPHEATVVVVSTK
jgi:hypothetical protein